MHTISSRSEESQVISFRTLRRLIGILGIALPWACWATNALVNQWNVLNYEPWVLLKANQPYVPEESLKSSISHFYYTAAGPLFIGILVTVSIFLFCYQGYTFDPTRDRSKWLSDRRVTFLAALFALVIVVFPTGESTYISDNIFIFTATGMIGTLHYIFAALFFLMISVLCLVNFRRKETPENFGRDPHDAVCLICGWVMISSLVIILVYHQLLASSYPLTWPVTFIFETVALTAFGIAWLVKGKADVIVKDLFA